MGLDKGMSDTVDRHAASFSGSSERSPYNIITEANFIYYLHVYWNSAKNRGQDNVAVIDIGILERAFEK